MARETIELVFLAALQLLPTRQRAVLILHDVLGWTARQSAEALDLSVAAANSALQVLTLALQDLDLVIEGDATTVTESGEIRRLRELYATQGWQAAVHDGALVVSGEFSAPSAGPPAWTVYEITPTTIVAVGMAPPYGATRWRFQ